MNPLLPYRIIGFLLFPVTALIGIFVTLAVFIALANPAMLLPIAIAATVVMYVIGSFIFLQKAIDRNQVCKSGLRDFIRVNAIVSIVFCFFCINSGIAMISNPELIRPAIKQMLEQQPGTGVSEDQMLRIVKGFMYVLSVFSILLVVHIFYTFRLLKQYQHMFVEKK